MVYIVWYFYFYMQLYGKIEITFIVLIIIIKRILTLNLKGQRNIQIACIKIVRYN